MPRHLVADRCEEVVKKSGTTTLTLKGQRYKGRRRFLPGGGKERHVTQRLEERRIDTLRACSGGVWVCNVEHGEHPMQKPLKLVSDWVANFTDPPRGYSIRSLVRALQAVAFPKLGRKFIGIEKWPDYFDLARRRIDAYRQTDLFAPTASRGNARRCHTI
jgi:hypothetical protein